MAITHVDTNTASNGSTTEITVTKPTGTASGHLLLAFITSNSQNVTPPSGWTELSDDVIEVFRLQVFYKVAGGSEPANYTFSLNDSTLMVATVSAFSGIDASDPIDIDPEIATDTSTSEPLETPDVFGGTNGRLLYLRACRDNTTTPITFTASSVTELSDHGASGFSVAYSHAVYLATSDYSTGGSKSGLNITANASDTHTITLTMGIKATSNPATMEVTLPTITDMSVSGSVAYPAEMDVFLPDLDMEFTGFFGNPEAELDVDVPITMEVEAAQDTGGTLEIEIMPIFDIQGETRRFAENVVVPDREERWLVITQEGWEPGIRNISFVPVIINLPNLQVQFAAVTDPFGDNVPATVIANAPTIFTTSTWSADDASATATANDAAVALGEIPTPSEVSVSVTANDATVFTTKSVSAGTATVTTEVFDVRGAQAEPEDAAVSVTANDPTVSAINATQANAGHVSVTCHN